MYVRARLIVGVLLVVAVSFSCRKQQPAEQAAPSAKSEQQHARDLSIDEARGGHTLKRHVGRTDDELRERLSQEQNISAASTYTDRATAERAVGEAIRDDKDKIERWMGRGARRPNLVLDYTDREDALGRVMNRRAMGSVPCDHAIIVLKADGSDYYVLTSYPECKP